MKSLNRMYISVLRTLLLICIMSKQRIENISIKIKNGFLNVKMIPYMLFKYQEAISLTTLDRKVIVDFDTHRPKARLGNL